MANAIDSLFIKLGLDTGDLQKGLQEVQFVIQSIDSVVRNFGQGMTDSLNAAESGAASAGAALAGVKDEAKEAGRELGAAGDQGEKATAKIEAGASA